MEEVKSAPSQAVARQGRKSKLETLRDDAELIGDAALAHQAESALAADVPEDAVRPAVIA